MSVAACSLLSGASDLTVSADSPETAPPASTTSEGSSGGGTSSGDVRDPRDFLIDSGADATKSGDAATDGASSGGSSSGTAVTRPGCVWKPVTECLPTYPIYTACGFVGDTLPHRYEACNGTLGSIDATNVQRPYGACLEGGCSSDPGLQRLRVRWVECCPSE